MEMNYLVLVLAALVPLIIGFIWYHPKAFGTMWMTDAGLTQDDMQNFNMIKVFGLTYFLSFMLAMIIQSLVIHQFSMYSILLNEPGFGVEGSEITNYINAFMEKYGTNFRTFKHGALHGTIAGLFIALPIMGINAMFERKGLRYVAVNTGFWVVCLALMGGIICQFA
jgi:hypothetical protein